MKTITDLLKLRLKPRYKWFSQTSPDAEGGWYGPSDTIEAAYIECISNELTSTIYVGQGRKLTKAEYEEFGVDFTWEVDTKNLI